MRSLFIRLQTAQQGTPAAIGRAAAEHLRKIADRIEHDGLRPHTYFQILDGSGQPIGHAGEEDDNDHRRGR